jgi:hypothetical protein
MSEGHWQLEGSAAELFQRYLVPAITLKWAEDFVRRAQLRTGELALDVACGTGVVARLAAIGCTPPERLEGNCAVFGPYSPAMIHDFDQAIREAHDNYPSWRLRANGVVDHVGQSAEQRLSIASERRRHGSRVHLDLTACAIGDRRAVSDDVAEKLSDIDQFVHRDVALAEPGDGHELFD